MTDTVSDWKPAWRIVKGDYIEHLAADDGTAEVVLAAVATAGRVQLFIRFQRDGRMQQSRPRFDIDDTIWLAPLPADGDDWAA